MLGWSSRAAPVLTLALSGIVCTACTEAVPPPEQSPRVDVPFEGVAFPNRRSPVEVPRGGLALVTDSLSDGVSAVDLAAARRVAVRPVGKQPVGIDGPGPIVVDAAAGAAFVALTYPVKYPGPHADHVPHVEPPVVQKLALDDLRVIGEVQVDLEPSDLELSEDGRRLVVSHFHADGLAAALEDPTQLESLRTRLLIADPAAIEPFLTPEPPGVQVCLGAGGLALSRPAGDRAYVACYGEDAIAIADLTAPELVARVPVAIDPGPPGGPTYGPAAVALSPNQALLAIGSGLTREVRFLDVESSTMRLDLTLALDARPVALAFIGDSDHLLVATRDPARVILLDTSTTPHTIALDRALGAEECDMPAAIALGPPGSALLVCEGDGTKPGQLVVMDTSTLAVRATVPVGQGARDAAWLGGGPQ
jgi:DNA-binding beta-propeller fold protein YncE